MHTISATTKRFQETVSSNTQIKVPEKDQVNNQSGRTQKKFNNSFKETYWV